MEARRVASILLLTFVMLSHRAWADVLLNGAREHSEHDAACRKMQRSLGTPVEIGLQSDPSTKYERYAVAVLVGEQALKKLVGFYSSHRCVDFLEDSLAFAGKAKTILYQEPPLEAIVFS